MVDSVMDELFETLVKEMPKGSSILDIGINDGKLTKRFIEELNPDFLKGVESETREKVRCVIPPTSNVELLYSQPIETLKDKRQYDLIIMFKTLHYTSFPEPAEALVIAKRFLSEDGLLLLGLALNAGTEDGDRRKLDLKKIKDQMHFHNFSPVFDKEVGSYDRDYYETHILLSRLST